MAGKKKRFYFSIIFITVALSFLFLNKFDLKVKAQAQATQDFYVAINGNDDNQGTVDQPFATIDKARDKIRNLKTSGQFNKPVNVYLRNGTYNLSKTFNLDTRDSGTEMYSISYQSYPGETAVISGGTKITGNWTPVLVNGKNIYKIGVADTWDFNSLFINNNRAIRARTPNIDENPAYNLIDGVNLTTACSAFNFKAGDISASWSNLNEVEVVSYRRWVQAREKVSSVSGNTVNFTGSLTTGYCYDWDYNSNTGRYYVENVFEALDSPGEWYLNKVTGDLYYYPLAGENIQTAEIIAPTLQQLVNNQGANFTIFNNLNFAHTDWALSVDGYSGFQAGRDIDSLPAFYLKATNTLISNSNFSHLGAYAIYNQLGRNEILRNKFNDVGGGGIRVSNDLIGSNIISDNDISDIGVIYKEGVGIWVQLSGNNTISHNRIHDANYSGISVGWQWNLGPSYAKNNIIEYNEIYNVMKELNDGAGIYNLGWQPGNIIQNNIVHDILATSFHLYPCGIEGIYLDQGSSEILVKNNLIYRSETGGLLLNQTYNNTIENNIFVDGKLTQFRFNSGPGPLVLPNGQEVQPSLNKFRKNIIYNTNPNSFYTGLSKIDNSSLSESDYNLVYYTVPQPASKYVDSYTHIFNGFNFNDWKAEFGFDLHSSISNPLFVDYAKNNFNLQPSSPAFGLGFQSFDVAKAGPRGGLLLFKMVDKSKVSSGNILNYKLTFINDGTMRTNVRIEDSLPSLTTFIVGSANHGGTFEVDKISWNYSNLAVNQSGYLSFKVNVN